MISTRRRVALFAAALTLQSLGTLAVAWLAFSGAARSAIVIGLAASFVPYVGVQLAVRDLLSRRRAEQFALAALGVLGLVLVAAPPVLSDDVYRFVWEGRLWLEGINPYGVPPSDPQLEPLRDELWALINNKPLASIYPPLSQALFVFIALVGGGVATLKLLALCAHAIAAIAVSRISGDPRASLALALNPLLLSEGALNGHLDVLTGLCLLLAAWGLARQRIALAVVATCAAAGLKAVGVVLVPLFVRRPKALAIVASGSAAFLAPLLLFRPATWAASGPLQFAERWRGNEGLYALVDAVVGQLAEAEQIPWLARIVCAGLVLIVAAAVVARNLSPLRAARIILWTTLLLSPQVHPWYLAWLLPLEVASGRKSGLVWSAAVLVAYAPLDRWLTEGVWDMPIALQVVEYVVVFAVLAWERRVQGSPISARGDRLTE